MTMLQQGLQLLGAVLILLAFAGTTFRIFEQRTFVYQGLNLAGSLILAVLAIQGRQWGFVLLEAVWSAISLYAIAALALRTR